MFKQIIGHQDKKMYFERAIKNDAYAHAYCFTGSDGIGKYTFARAVAKAVMCKTESDIAKFDSGNHPDILEILSDKRIKTDDAAEVQKFISIKPLYAGVKVVIIDDAGTMTMQAQNKLLKTLEEPTGHALIILITKNRGQLLDTIKSRVISTAFNPLQTEDIKVLIDRYNLDFSDNLMHIVGGRFGDYLKWQQDDAFNQKMQKLMDLFLNLFAGDAVKWVRQLPILSELKDDSALFFNMLRMTTRDYIVASKGFSEDKLKLPAYTKIFLQRKDFCNLHTLYGMIENIDSAEKALSRNQNYLLITEGLMFKIQEALHG